MKLLLKTLPPLLSLLPTLAVGSPTLSYQVKVDESDPQQLIMSVDTSSLGEFSVMPSRTLKSHIQPQLVCVSGEHGRGALPYEKPVTCQRVEWKNYLFAVTDAGFDASKNRSAFDEKQGWYFLSEWNSLPRFKRGEDTEVDSQVCVPGGQCESLPSAEQPPLFMLWGLDKTQIKLGDKQVDIYSDTPLVTENMKRWRPTLERQLRYINQVFPNHEQKQWRMGFLKRERYAGNIGGATGNTLILVNAMIDDGKVTNDSLQMMLKIAAHESVHMLQTQKTPLWANESLAEYYAIKSLNGSPFEMKSPLGQWHDFATKYPFVKTGLLAAHHKVTENKQYQYYPLFYRKGAAFWFELDTALHQSGKSLDTLLAAMRFDADGGFDKATISLIEQQIGTKTWSDIEGRYLRYYL
ncbi:hypothetical protein AB2S62_08110 [Vibrio sp. NTOU-M3]|uniref:hypothetical protein n=1 Tax=Vibrio sp. NTOU-M3 TaxID=3234954 RepID=UPI00349F38CF